MLDLLAKHAGFLFQGVLLTLLLSATAVVCGAVFGLALALFRVGLGRFSDWLGGFLIDILRSVPFIVQLVWWFYALPVFTGLRLTAIESGLVALSLYAAAYFAEAFRAGLKSVTQSEREAALAIGMTWFQSQRRVILPIAARRVIPPVTNVVIIVVKDSSVVSVLGVAELMYQGGSLASFTLRPMEVLTVVALIYVALTLPLTVIGEAVRRRLAWDQ